MSKSASLSFENITFSFGKNIIVSDFSLDVKKGSFTTLLGPSGCGKTTLLRLVSGFLEPSEGSIKIDGINQNKLPPEAREIGMVFQDYALFPHMTVEKNLFYGLGIKNNKKEDKEKNIALIHKTARVLGIYNLLDRFPHELSGGQQQRVALGRAIVLEPKILLMDEPLSSLDAKLRTQVREELQEIQKNLG
ncbi:MAG: ABC transporter ATP-binding protein, partial [Treponema sp.]|nr:ABC transporter ATP-binding protein [Treponema sp.]